MIDGRFRKTGCKCDPDVEEYLCPQCVRTLRTDLTTAQRDAERWENHYKDAIGTAKHFESLADKLQADNMRLREALEPVTKLALHQDLTNHEVLAGIINGAKQALTGGEAS